MDIYAELDRLVDRVYDAVKEEYRDRIAPAVLRAPMPAQRAGVRGALAVHLLEQVAKDADVPEVRLAAAECARIMIQVSS